MKTKYRYEDLPPMLNPAPVKSEQVEDDTDSWQIYQYENIGQNSNER